LRQKLLKDIEDLEKMEDSI